MSLAEKPPATDFAVGIRRFGLLIRCARRSFEATLVELGAQGFRALGVASRVVDASRQTAAISDESDLVFSGFAVFLDPPKGKRRRYHPSDRRRGHLH